jgi:DNA/RNA endonuclease YhcR with UshA esterase domain
MKAHLLTVTFLCLCAVLLRAEDEIFSATDLAVLTERAGLETVVEGVVQETGTTQEGGITFLNLDAPKKRGFTAVIFRKDYDSFVLDFASLTGKTIRVRGPVEIFRDRPQIVLRAPAQLEIIEETAPAP